MARRETGKVCCDALRRAGGSRRLGAVADGYLERILNARVYDVAIESPLDVARNLSRRLGNQVLLKREDMQPIFSFKLRGAFNKMARLPEAELRRGVIADRRCLDGRGR